MSRLRQAGAPGFPPTLPRSAGATEALEPDSDRFKWGVSEVCADSRQCGRESERVGGVGEPRGRTRWEAGGEKALVCLRGAAAVSGAGFHLHLGPEVAAPLRRRDCAAAGVARSTAAAGLRRGPRRETEDR